MSSGLPGDPLLAGVGGEEAGALAAAEEDGRGAISGSCEGEHQGGKRGVLPREAELRPRAPLLVGVQDGRRERSEAMRGQEREEGMRLKFECRGRFT